MSIQQNNQRQIEAFDNVDKFKNIAKLAIASKSYGDLKEEQMIPIMLTAWELGIGPMRAINKGLGIVQGNVFMYTSMMVELIRKKGHSITSKKWDDKECHLLGKRKDNGDEFEVIFNMQDASYAGLTSRSIWKQYPKAMLYNRAMSQLAKTLFPDCLGNCYTEDESHDIKKQEPTTINYETVADIKSIELEDSPEKFKIENPVQLVNENEIGILNKYFDGIDSARDEILKKCKISSFEEMPSKWFEAALNRAITIRQNMDKEEFASEDS